MPHRTTRFLVLLLLGFLALGPLFAEGESKSGASSLSKFSLDASFSAAGSSEPGRPLLPRAETGMGLTWILRKNQVIFPALALRYLDVLPSVPDPSLFLYRGYAGLSLWFGAGYVFPLPRAAGGGGGDLEVLGGPGLAGLGDSGTNLLSLIPLIRLEGRWNLPLRQGWGWSLGLPLEIQKRASALTFSAGISAGISLSPVKGGKK